MGRRTTRFTGSSSAHSYRAAPVRRSQEEAVVDSAACRHRLRHDNQGGRAHILSRSGRPPPSPPRSAARLAPVSSPTNGGGGRSHRPARPDGEPAARSRPSSSSYRIAKQAGRAGERTRWLRYIASNLARGSVRSPVVRRAVKRQMDRASALWLSQLGEPAPASPSRYLCQNLCLRPPLATDVRSSSLHGAEPYKQIRPRELREGVAVTPRAPGDFSVRCSTN